MAPGMLGRTASGSVGPGDRQHVVPDRALRAIPPDREPLLAAEHVPRQGAGGELVRLDRPMLLDDADNPAGEKGPEPEPAGEKSDGRPFLDERTRRADLDPAHPEHRPVLQRRACVLDDLQPFPKSHPVMVEGIAGWRLPEQAPHVRIQIRELALPCQELTDAGFGWLRVRPET